MGWRVVPRHEWDSLVLKPGQRLQVDLGPPWLLKSEWYFNQVMRQMAQDVADKGWEPVGWWWDPKTEVLTIHVEAKEPPAGSTVPAALPAGWPVVVAVTVAAVALAISSYFGYKEIREVRLFWGQIAELPGGKWLPWVGVALIAGALALGWRWAT